MEDKHHIDDLFKDRLSNYTVPAPMHIWKRMNEEKGGGSALGWIKGLIPVALLAIIATIYFINPSQNKIDASNSTGFQKATSSSVMADLNEKSGTKELDQRSRSGEISTINESNINENSSLITKTSSQNTSNPVNKSRNDQNLVNSSQVNKMLGNENDIHTNSHDDKNAEEQDHNNDLRQEKATLENSDELNQEGQKSNLSESIASITHSINSISALPYLRNQLYSKTLDNVYLSPCHFSPTDDCFDDRYDAKNYADFIFSADFVFKKLTSRFDQTDDYLSERIATEYFYYAYSSGFRLSRVSEQGIAMRTGLIYSQINEVFDHTSTEYVPKSINVTIDTLYNTNGDTIFVWDTISVISVEEKRIVKTNKFRLLDIPLTAGFEYQVGKFVFNINGGIMLNLFMNTKGNILDLSGEVATIDSDSPHAVNAYKNKVGLSLVGSFGVNYRLNESVMILFEPYFRKIVKPVSHQDYPLEQKYSIMGLRTGLRYKF